MRVWLTPFAPAPPKLKSTRRLRGLPGRWRLWHGGRWGDVLPWGAAAARLAVFAPPNASDVPLSSLPFAAAPAGEGATAPADSEREEGMDSED
jgi:hypothetical protein